MTETASSGHGAQHSAPLRTHICTSTRGRRIQQPFAKLRLRTGQQLSLRCRHLLGVVHDRLWAAVRQRRALCRLQQRCAHIITRVACFADVIAEFQSQTCTEHHHYSGRSANNPHVQAKEVDRKNCALHHHEPHTLSSAKHGRVLRRDLLRCCQYVRVHRKFHRFGTPNSDGITASSANTAWMSTFPGNTAPSSRRSNQATHRAPHQQCSRVTVSYKSRLQPPVQ